MERTPEAEVRLEIPEGRQRHRGGCVGGLPRLSSGWKPLWVTRDIVVLVWGGLLRLKVDWKSLRVASSTVAAV